MMSIQAGPHYEIPSTEFAAWVEEQGVDRWWNVDGDPLLTERLSFPAPGDELAAELRAINRPLLVRAKKDDVQAKGQPTDKTALDGLAGRLGENLQCTGPPPPWADDRLFDLCWKGSADEWLLIEDRETTEQSRADAATEARKG